MENPRELEPPTFAAIDLDPRDPIRDRDYLLDRHGVVFSVIGDVHPPTHYLGFAKYYPSEAGDRFLLGRRYQRNGSVPRSASLLADRPECFVHSSALGVTMTALPRGDVVAHYAARPTLRNLDRDRIAAHGVGRDLLTIADLLVEYDAIDHVGVTGSFLLGCPNDESDIDLVCYGSTGRDGVRRLFADCRVIRPYAGADFDRLCRRRARDLPGLSLDTLRKRERRRLQGLTASADVHVNCEPLRADDDPGPASATATAIGHVTLVAVVTDHDEALVTPAWYGIDVEHVLFSSADDAEAPASRITSLRSYLGVYRSAFRAGERICASGLLLRLLPDDTFAVELTNWTGTTAYGANLVDSRW